MGQPCYLDGRATTPCRRACASLAPIPCRYARSHNGKSEQEAGTARTREQASVGEAEGAGGQGGAAPGETRKAEAWCSGGGKRVAAEGDSGGAHEEGVSRSEGGCQGSSEGAELLAEGAPRESGRPPMGERRTPSTPRGSGAGDGSESGRVGGGWSGMGASTQAALDGLIEGVVAGRVDSEQEGTQTAERRPAGVSLGYQSCPAQTAGTTGRGAEGMARKDAEKRAQLMAAAQNGTDQVALMRLLADDARKVATMQQMQRTVPEIEPQPGSPGMREVSESAHPC